MHTTRRTSPTPCHATRTPTRIASTLGCPNLHRLLVRRRPGLERLLAGDRFLGVRDSHATNTHQSTTRASRLDTADLVKQMIAARAFVLATKSRSRGSPRPLAHPPSVLQPFVWAALRFGRVLPHSSFAGRQCARDLVRFGNRAVRPAGVMEGLPRTVFGCGGVVVSFRPLGSGPAFTTLPTALAAFSIHRGRG